MKPKLASQARRPLPQTWGFQPPASPQRHVPASSSGHGRSHLLIYKEVPTDSWAPEAEAGLSAGLAPHHSTLRDISMQHHIVDIRHIAHHSTELPHVGVPHVGDPSHAAGPPHAVDPPEHSWFSMCSGPLLGGTLDAEHQVVLDLTEVLHRALVLSVRTRGAGALGLRAPCLVDLGHIPPGTSPPGSESAL